MKRFLRLFGVTVLSFSILSFCSKEEDKNNNGEGEIINPIEPIEPVVPSEPEEPVVPEEPVEKTFCELNPKICNPDISSNTMTYEASEEEIMTTYDSVVKSVVTVMAFSEDYDSLGSGSGVIYEAKEGYSYIYTNAHVVNTTVGRITSLIYEVIYYNNIRVAATVVAQDPAEDIAILKAEIKSEDDYDVATIGNSDNLKHGQAVLTLGSPLGAKYRNTITKGIISGLNVEIEADNDGDGVKTDFYLIQTDAALSSGNSGGPMFTIDGQFIGINTLKLTNNSTSSVEGFNFSIPSNHVVAVASSLLDKGSYSRAKVGLTVQDIGEFDLYHREEEGISVDLGIYVISVLEAGASYGIVEAEKVITHIGDVKIVNRNTFVTELLKHKAGDKISLSLCDKDGSNIHMVEVTLK